MSTSRMLLVALLCLPAACDKGPQGDAPAAKPAAKVADTPAEEVEKAPADKPAEAPADKAEEAEEATTDTGVETAEGKSYGDGVKTAEAVAISAILDDPSSFEGKTVRVEGMVTDVCPKRGCWFELAGDKPGKKMRFKVEDGVMVFPMDAKGKFAVAEGVVAVQKLSLEDTRKYAAHHAEETGEEFDPESVTEPETIIRINGSGAVIRDSK